MNNHENIRDKSAPFIVASDLCNSAVSMHIQAWVKDTDFWGTKCGMYDSTKLKPYEVKIGISYLQ
jgi:hypothetical protein